MFIYKTAEFAPVWTTILKIQMIFVHQTLTEHALLMKSRCRIYIEFTGNKGRYSKRLFPLISFFSQIEFVEDLPKTISGKIRRVELRNKEWGRKAI